MIKKTIDLLRNSNSPIIFAGGGTFWSDSSQELKEFIDNSGIPFYTTPMTRGIVSDDHQFSFPAARSSAFRETDFVLVLAYEVKNLFICFWEPFILKLMSIF